ncbi:MAG TPA: CRISPR-associated protein Cas4 [Rhodanobacter sp.]
MDDEASIPISALQHYLYCPRQCALIHVERVWAENLQTAEGRLLHERSDRPANEKRRGVHTATALAIASERLGISGIADVVEFHIEGDVRRPYPVEYKRGRPKPHRADEVQLCAQALCLEEMLGVHVPEGALFYGKVRRRQVVVLDDSLRALTLEVIVGVRKMLDARRTPPAHYDPGRCDACSLIELCRPRLLPAGQQVQAWLQRQIDKE